MSWKRTLSCMSCTMLFSGPSSFGRRIGAFPDGVMGAPPGVSDAGESGTSIGANGSRASTPGVATGDACRVCADRVSPDACGGDRQARTLSRRASMMPLVGGAVSGGSSRFPPAGVLGWDSPSTAVCGRKSEATMIRCVLYELHTRMRPRPYAHYPSRSRTSSRSSAAGAESTDRRIRGHGE
jgi:hypothetical protein